MRETANAAAIDRGPAPRFLFARNRRSVAHLRKNGPFDKDGS